jgi:hypothetical protein
MLAGMAKRKSWYAVTVQGFITGILAEWRFRREIDMSRWGSTIPSVLAAVLFLAASASAGPLTWVVNGQFDDGGTISGSFVYDADTGQYSSVDVITTPGSTRSGADYLLYPCCTYLADFLVFVTTTGDLTGTPVLTAYLLSSMTNAGGTINLATAGSGFEWYSEESCLDVFCTDGTGAQRYVVSGEVSTTTIPEPSTFLLALPLCALIALRRPQHNVPRV